MGSHNQKFDMIVRGIVMTREENGATIEEIRSDYFEMMGEQWPLKCRQTKSIVSYLNEIGGLMMEKLDSGLCIWYIDDMGSSLHYQQVDSNNNTEVAANQLDGSGGARNDGLRCVNPPVRRQILTSFVSGNTGPSMATTTTTTTSEAITASTSAASQTLEEHGCEPNKHKSPHNASYPHGEKRVKDNETDPTQQMPLNEQNLNLHNWNSGVNGVTKQVTTSTEKENSMLVSNGAANGAIDAIECIEEIVIVDDSDCEAPIKVTELKKLQKAFPERCTIDEKSNSVLTISATSTDSNEDGLVPAGYAIVGDDFMRSMISFELYGGDFTNEDDKNFSFCFPGQTVRAAYYLILDRQNEFKARHPKIVVNVGAIDILLLRNLTDIQAEYARLVQAITTIGCVPILTSIPNIVVSPNNPNKKIIRQMVLLLNRFIDDLVANGHHFLDLYPHLDSSDYHQQPKITDANENLEIHAWSASGRKKIIEALSSIF